MSIERDPSIKLHEAGTLASNRVGTMTTTSM